MQMFTNPMATSNLDIEPPIPPEEFDLEAMKNRIQELLDSRQKNNTTPDVHQELHQFFFFIDIGATHNFEEEIGNDAPTFSGIFFCSLMSCRLWGFKHKKDKGRVVF